METKKLRKREDVKRIKKTRKKKPFASNYTLLQEYLAVQQKIDNYGSTSNTYRGFAVSFVIAAVIAGSTGVGIVSIPVAFLSVLAVSVWEYNNEQYVNALTNRAIFLERIISTKGKAHSPNIAFTLRNVGQSLPPKKVTHGYVFLKIFFFLKGVTLFLFSKRRWYVVLMLVLAAYFYFFLTAQAGFYYRLLLGADPQLTSNKINIDLLLSEEGCFSKQLRKNIGLCCASHDIVGTSDNEFYQTAFADELDRVAKTDILEKNCFDEIERAGLGLGYKQALLAGKSYKFNKLLILKFFPMMKEAPND